MLVKSWQLPKAYSPIDSAVDGTVKCPLTSSTPHLSSAHAWPFPATVNGLDGSHREQPLVPPSADVPEYPAEQMSQDEEPPTEEL